MVDIATRSASQVAPYAPFDWQAVDCGPAQEVWHDYSNPCADAGYHASVQMLRAPALDDTLNTAVILSLFTDARADASDTLPLNVTDRRGWCGEEVFAKDTGGKVDRWGSLLWLYYATKVSDDVLERARFAAWESLQWLVRDGIADRVDVSAQWVDDALAVRPQIYQPGIPQPVYDVLWRTTIIRAPS